MDIRILFLKKKIIKNPQNKWTLEELANAVNLSSSHLLRIFRDNLKTTPISFIRDLRLKKAKKLLKNSFLNIKEIGFAVGIGDQSHFVRYFKNKYGCTPTDYRKFCYKKLLSQKHLANK